jgi:hypothetical protein
MLVNAIVGFSASLRKNTETLSGFLDDVICGMSDRPDEVVKQARYSSNDGCIGTSIDFIKNHSSDRVLLVGKSLGAVKTWWLIRERWDFFEGEIRHGRRFGVVLIDPHGRQMYDGIVGSYGVRHMAIEFSRKWICDEMLFRCIYQRNKYPRGAMLNIGSDAVNAENIRLGEHADHFDVTDMRTQAGQEVAGQIRGVVRWLMS